MYKKNNHLKKRKQFNYVNKKGNTINLGNCDACESILKIRYVDTTKKSLCYKVGFSVSKKVGNAVTRNKIKRRLRESFRLLNIDIPNNFYFVVIAKHPIVYATFEEIKLELSKSITQMLEKSKNEE